MELESEITDVDLQLALKLKNKYPEHFQNLVRMHLSFALDMNVEENQEPAEKIRTNPNKWCFHRKTKAAKDFIDGHSLSDTKIARMYALMSFLSQKENIIQEGIFRKTGAVSRQSHLKNCLNEGMTIDFSDNNFTVHDCASVLKNFLSELPEPLVTDAYFPLCCQISEWCKCEEFETRLLRSMQLLMLLLPSNNALLLKHVINLLQLTSMHAEENKMSAENLATLFTPHILCPRKLSGELLHTNAQMLYQIVVFMIECGLELFRIPAELAADIRLYWHEKEKKKLAPKNCLNESTAESCIVNSVFSFVDREKTARENVTNPTETALAQLYAHIQSLPESSKKHKLVKQFNKENGYGTPKRVLNNNDKPHSLTRNISDSLKKHMFSKAVLKNEKYVNASVRNKPAESNVTPNIRSKSLTRKLFDKKLDCMEWGCSDMSDDGCVIKKFKINDDVDSKVTEGKLVVSSSYDIDDENEDEPNENEIHIGTKVTPLGIKKREEGSLVASGPFQGFQTPKITRKSLVNGKSSIRCKLSTTSHFHNTLTSTPAPACLSNDMVTPSPFCCSSEDMSPITLSAKRMPRSMQEIMMTPRSRQPVLAVSGSNNASLSSKDKNDFYLCSNDQENGSKSHIEENFQTCHDTSKDPTNVFDNSSESITDTFREYLCSKKMLTTSIVDDSFSSRTGDFDPSTISDDKMSDSLLYCLDGGMPSQKMNFECEDISLQNKDNGNDHDYGYRECSHNHETLL